MEMYAQAVFKTSVEELLTGQSMRLWGVIEERGVSERQARSLLSSCRMLFSLWWTADPTPRPPQCGPVPGTGIAPSNTTLCHSEVLVAIWDNISPSPTSANTVPPGLDHNWTKGIQIHWTRIYGTNSNGHFTVIIFNKKISRAVPTQMCSRESSAWLLDLKARSSVSSFILFFIGSFVKWENSNLATPNQGAQLSWLNFKSKWKTFCSV